MKTLKLLLPALVVALFAVTGCQTVGQHAAGVREAQVDGERLTVGKVQREIRVGMSGAEVVRALGSPNVVTTDEQRREVWVYDKISTSRVTSESVGGVWILILYGQTSSGARSTSQRTLTVIIKFDKEGKVRDFAYHTSRF